MRAISALALAGLSAACLADRLVSIPVGKKLLNGTYRLEGLLDVSAGGRNRFSLAASLAPHIDAEAYVDRLEGGRDYTSFDVGYNYTAPLTDFAPGVSFGVLDVLSRSLRGRRFYGAVTFRVGLEGETVNDVPLEATAGVATHSRNPFFVGVLLPLSSRYRLIGEHNGMQVTAGFEIRPVPEVAARFLFSRDRTLVSLSLTRRF